VLETANVMKPGSELNLELYDLRVCMVLDSV
jgi:hypothetical protein